MQSRAGRPSQPRLSCLLSVIFLNCYLAFSLPTIATGLAVPVFGSFCAAAKRGPRRCGSIATIGFTALIWN